MTDFKVGETYILKDDTPEAGGWKFHKPKVGMVAKHKDTGKLWMLTRDGWRPYVGDEAWTAAITGGDEAILALDT